MPHRGPRFHEIEATGAWFGKGGGLSRDISFQPVPGNKAVVHFWNWFPSIDSIQAIKFHKHFHTVKGNKLTVYILKKLHSSTQMTSLNFLFT